MDHFFHEICSGALQQGDKLPSVRETAVTVGVNPNTVQRTYAEMERKGILESRRGQGSFVTNDEKLINELRQEITQQQVTYFIDYMKKNGFSNQEIIEKVKKELE